MSSLHFNVQMGIFISVVPCALLTGLWSSVQATLIVSLHADSLVQVAQACLRVMLLPKNLTSLSLSSLPRHQKDSSNFQNT